MKRLNIKQFSLSDWGLEMYINLNTGMVYSLFNGRYTLVRNKYTLKDIYSYVLVAFKSVLTFRQVNKIKGLVA